MQNEKWFTMNRRCKQKEKKFNWNLTRQSTLSLQFNHLLSILTSSDCHFSSSSISRWVKLSVKASQDKIQQFNFTRIQFVNRIKTKTEKEEKIGKFSFLIKYCKQSSLSFPKSYFKSKCFLDQFQIFSSNNQLIVRTWWRALWPQIMSKIE